jgi:hypothetical protein
MSLTRRNCGAPTHRYPIQSHSIQSLSTNYYRIIGRMRQSLTAIVPVLIGLTLTGVVLGSAAWTTVTPVKIQVVKNSGDYVPPAWDFYRSPVLVQNGVDIHSYLACMTGSGFSPTCTLIDLVGNNRPDVVGESSVSQTVTLPDNISHYEFSIATFGLSGMSGVGNGFNLTLCSFPNTGCAGTPEQAIKLELYRCVAGDSRCTVNATIGLTPAYEARLTLSTMNGEKTLVSKTEVENLTAAHGVTLDTYLYGDASIEGGRLTGTRVSAKFLITWSPGQSYHYLALENVSYDISKLDVFKIGFTSACAGGCYSTRFDYTGPYANVSSSLYTVTAPMSNLLHLQTLNGALLLATVASIPTIIGTSYYVRRRRGRGRSVKAITPRSTFNQMVKY